MYILTLTDFEVDSLRWFADRGYDCGLYAALEHRKDEEYAVAEHKAWEIQQAAEYPDYWFPCLNWKSTLGCKIREFLDAIV